MAGFTTRFFRTIGYTTKFLIRAATKYLEDVNDIQDKETAGNDSATSSTSGPSSPTLDRSKSKADKKKKSEGGLFRGLNWMFGGRKGKHDDESLHDDDKIDDEWIVKELDGATGARRFTYKVLSDATKNFNSRAIVGRGGFGHVYKGFLKGEGMRVAIKKMDQNKTAKHGKQEYLSEIKTLAKLTHPNLVKIVGWCHEERKLLLVYEFIPNGNLGSHLHLNSRSTKRPLDWKTRYKIILGLASALQHLHEELSQCVLHRDIKPTNIMLDSDFNPKLADFGLAMLTDHGSVSKTATVAGTLGYLAPEYITSGNFDKKTDVYSFGIVALEIACGRHPFAPKGKHGHRSLVEMVWDLHGKGQLVDGADEMLHGSFDREQMKRLMLVGIWCTLPDVESRPFIGQASGVLNYSDPLPNLPVFSTLPKYPGMPSNSREGSLFTTRHTDHVSTENNTRVYSQVCTEILMTEGDIDLDVAAGSDSPPKAEHRASELDFDIGIPANYQPAAGQLQPFHVSIIKGLTEGLSGIIQTEPKFDVVIENIRKCTSVLVTFQLPVSDWSSLAQYVLQAAKDIDDFKEQLGRDAADVQATAEILSTHEMIVGDCAKVIESSNDNLEDARQQLATAKQKHAELMSEYTELNKRLAILEILIKDADEDCSLVQHVVTTEETTIAQNSELIQQLRHTIASTSETLKTKEAKQEERDNSITTLVTSMLSRILSFSNNPS